MDCYSLKGSSINALLFLYSLLPQIICMIQQAINYLKWIHGTANISLVRVISVIISLAHHFKPQPSQNSGIITFCFLVMILSKGKAKHVTTFMCALFFFQFLIHNHLRSFVSLASRYAEVLVKNSIHVHIPICSCMYLLKGL